MSLTHPGRRVLLVACCALLLAIGTLLALVANRASGPSSSSGAIGASATRTSASLPNQTAPEPTAAARVKGDVAQAEVEQLRSVEKVSAVVTPRRISGDAAEQPDLYAAEFVRRLLTQDYSGVRTDHLAWVQAESAMTSEPLVVGLVPPELRGRLALHSVTERSGGRAAVPDEVEWRSLAAGQAYTTVRVDRVVEPMAWSNAVASGRITDPGVTGREVSATVTLHAQQQGREVTSTTSVALTLNLEGPPSRDRWGFITLVTYTAVPVTAP
ncbi:hypothetical protein FHX52_3241 [Humibacillus xanthopallidus]|uniref:Uncharacterized protein n=1 Tax=Humibacillus xanthopallidus TaxID=412689 RepID=A0A543PR07_9MICO|nr:hypothetical protein [Humibacillus xanthopallidus]TQN46516.1 hypothetical protein FHX52_3241 [Humibacillus xanthopallidus]